MQTLCNPKCLKISTLIKPPLFSIFTSTLSSISNCKSEFLENHPILPFLEQVLNHRHFDLRSVHAHCITSGLITDPFGRSRIIQFCLHPNHQNLNYAVSIFNSLQRPDVYTWNLMISTHIQYGLQHKSIAFYFQMRARDAPPNSYTFALAVKACSGNTNFGRLIHGQLLKCGVMEFIIIKNSLLNMYCSLGFVKEAQELFKTSYNLDLISWNTLLSAYAKAGDMNTARNTFERMPSRNMVSWSALIDGFVREKDYSEALKLFYRLQYEGLKPDHVVLVSVLKACAHSGSLDEGCKIHHYVNQNDLMMEGNVILKTAFIDMYFKCGCIDEAMGLFENIPNKNDVVLWNAIISGLAMHGESQKALEVFKKMKSRPNRSTYIAVLTACVHGGMVDEGIEIFESMKVVGVGPEMDHYGCVAGLLGRAGRVKEAEKVLVSMPMEAEASQWGALMSACKMHGDVEVGERVGRRLIEMEPLEAGRYIMLANLYTDLGEWEKAEEIRREMEDNGVKKERGNSLMR